MISRVALILLFAPHIVWAQNLRPIDGELEKIRARYHLPALAAIALKDGKVVAISTVGLRKVGSPERVTVNDRWHIGSCTKSMTATIAAMFVEKGRLNWDTKLIDIFPEWSGEMRPGWRNVTIEHLLTHRSGAPAEPPADLWDLAWRRVGTPVEQRLAFVHGLLTREPEAPAGTKYIYSNQGYAIAGAALEHIAGQPWEQLMREMLFSPLDMTSAGFGAPASPGAVDQPWGHIVKNTKVRAVPPGPDADNPPAIAPATSVNSSLTDLGRYCAMHASGERTGSLLNSDSFVRLHTPAKGQEYAMGWFALRREWAGGTALDHDGSNTTFHMSIWIAPMKGTVFIAVTNIELAGDRSATATDDAIGVLVDRFAVENNDWIERPQYRNTKPKHQSLFWAESLQLLPRQFTW